MQIKADLGGLASPDSLKTSPPNKKTRKLYERKEFLTFLCLSTSPRLAIYTYEVYTRLGIAKEKESTFRIRA